MEIIIGRDMATARLRLTTKEGETLWGEPGSVPLTVACPHCKLIIDGNGAQLKNIDINAYTYVNGVVVETMTLSREDKIELGTDRFELQWSAIDAVAPADIRHLAKVWDDFDRHRIDQQIADRRFNSLRSATGIITMAAIALSITTGRQSYWFVLLYVAAIVISLLFTVKAYKDASAIPQRMQEHNRRFQQDYICPRCHHFLGNQPYEILTQSDHCPYCKTQFIH